MRVIPPDPQTTASSACHSCLASTSVALGEASVALYGTCDALRCPVTTVTLEPGHPLRRPLLTRNALPCTLLRGSMPPDGTLFTTGCGLSRSWMLLMGYKGIQSRRWVRSLF
jgi:hypothetical protein